MKNKEIEYLLNEMKDTTLDYVGTNGCLYQDLERKELNLLLSYIEQLEKRIYEARKMIFDNYGVLDKYEIEMLDDILKGDSDE